MIPCLRGTPEAIDGDLSDWNLDVMTPAVLDVTGQLYTGQASWTGPADCSGTFYLLWDDKNIYMAAVVKDDKLSMTKTDGNIWNADCIEVFFSTTNAVPPHLEHYQYGFNANAQKWNWCNMDSGGQVLPDYLQVAAARTADGYICEAAIEYGRMSALKFVAGDAIGFHPVIDDTEATDREIQMTWTSREAHDQSLGFGHMILSSDPALPKGLSRGPSPANRAVDVPADTILSWAPGQYAASHDIYLGTALDAVNDATRANPMGVLVGQGRTAVEFDPAGLAYGTTYYWRVDEVNAPPGSGLYKGYVWSFTTEPYTYTIPSVTATASSAGTTQGMTPVKTVDGSGLNPDGQHSSETADGWLSAMGFTLPAWIQFQFDQAYLIRQMKVWNSNGEMEQHIGWSAKSVLIEYSLDGATWTALKTEEFPKADGSDTYAGFLVDLGEVLAKFVRLTIQTNWGNRAQTGLSEVRFFHVPLQAFMPQPADAATGVSVDASLNWRPGRKASSHQVFFGTDQAAVAGGTVAARTTTEHRYVPGALNLGTTYYWKVDEVNTVTWPGELWSFSTLEYMTVDDFESYTNNSPNRVFQAWIDGAGFSPDEFFPNGNSGNSSGSLVGYDPMAGNIMETSIVHGGRQAMPMEYNNVDAPYYSEAERTFDATQNWMTSGATDLSLWFRGRPANRPDQLYVVVQDNANKTVVVKHPNGVNAVLTDQWTQWKIPLSQLASVNTRAVRKMTIGVGDRSNPKAGGAGMLYIDDIGYGHPLSSQP